MILQKPHLPSFEHNMYEKSFKPSEIFFLFALMGYTKHVHAALHILWVVLFSKLPKAYVMPSSIFSQSLNSAVYSTLGVTMWRQCLLPHMEVISIDAINSI